MRVRENNEGDVGLFLLQPEQQRGQGLFDEFRLFLRLTLGPPCVAPLLESDVNRPARNGASHARNVGGDRWFGARIDNVLQ